MDRDYVACIGLHKRFGATVALDDVSLSLPQGGWIGLVGENGAGKSTLLRALSGVLQPDSGELWIRGERLALSSRREAYRRGVFLWSQTGEDVPAMSLYENVYLGYHGRFTRAGMLDHRAMLARAEPHIRDVLGDEVDPREQMDRVDHGRRQLFQMARILACAELLEITEPVLLVDEATAALDEPQSRHLFTLLRRLNGAGSSIIYVSHRLRELIGTVERIVVMRDGKVTGEVDREQASEAALHALMVGRERESNYYLEDLRGEPDPVPVLEVASVGGASPFGKVEDVSFTVRRGEIVGVAGVEGSGKEMLARLLIGADKSSSGSVAVGGRAVSRLRDPRAAVKQGIGLLPRDRLGESLIVGKSITFNATLCLDRSARRGAAWWSSWWLPRAVLDRLAAPVLARLRVTPAPGSLPIEVLSGGNQQKVALAKWALADVDVLVAVDPTQGVDVGARHECYRWFREFCSEGKCVVLISSDLPELVGLASRIVVLRHGRVVGEVTCGKGGSAIEEEVVRMMVA